jgi:murein DD-endopeptidase MepM/ murein hydrolase activator NlpD
MRSRRRRRWLRDETIAPWLTLVLFVSAWWLAARLLIPASDGAPLGAPAIADGLDAPAPPKGESAAREPTLLPDMSTGTARDREQAPSIANDDVAYAAAGTKSEEHDASGVVVPVAGVDAASLSSTFDEARGGGSRRHEAMDILAPRGTPVLAAVDGEIVKLFTSAAGGLTIYQFDADERYCYYYAHLDSYTANLTEGQRVGKGQVIGYVGTTGNAPPDTPHLHFAIHRLGPEKRWWEGEPLDPMTFLR